MESIHLFRHCSRVAMGHRRLCRLARQPPVASVQPPLPHAGLCRHHCRTAGVLQLHPFVLDFAGTPTPSHDGRDAPVVFVLPATRRTDGLLALEIQVDTLFLYTACPGVHLRKPLQARDTLQDTHACAAEPVVCPTRHRLYVRLCPARRRHAYGVVYSRKKQVATRCPDGSRQRI